MTATRQFVIKFCAQITSLTRLLIIVENIKINEETVATLKFIVSVHRLHDIGRAVAILV